MPRKRADSYPGDGAIGPCRETTVLVSYESARPSGQLPGSRWKSVPQPQVPIPSSPLQLQSQQVTLCVIQQPEAYQVVLMMHGLAQMPVLLQPEQGQAGPGKAQIVPKPALARSGRTRLPAATPASPPKTRSNPRPKKPRRVVFRAISSVTGRSGSFIDPPPP